ncbi:MAG TPA: N-acetylmuramoyl-L-alanine amidase, partial [Steroidobacter sp.]|nr:N-acetylmuramoyl-L-alanine amidase [Steroidobacter sp.]
LVETAFISNPTEEARLTDRRHQQRIAEAIHRGVRSYFQSSPPPGTRFAQLRAIGGARTMLATSEAGETATGASN